MTAPTQPESDEMERNGAGNQKAGRRSERRLLEICCERAALRKALTESIWSPWKRGAELSEREERAHRQHEDPGGNALAEEDVHHAGRHESKGD